jgi:DNA-binding XRE family transcriptional regulator
MAARGLATSSDRAGHVGVSRVTVSRIESGEVKPGERFIAAVLWSEGAKFEDLFEVIAERVTTERIA